MCPDILKVNTQIWPNRSDMACWIEDKEIVA